MNIQIKSWITGRVLFEGEFGSLKLCVEAAVKARADLAGADLAGAIYEGPPAATPEQATTNLDVVREIILAEPNRLFMGHWHDNDGWKKRTCAEEAVCGTTHCLAGWLQVCSTDEAVRKLPAAFAGAIQAPVAGKMFYRDTGEVMDWLKNRDYAKEQADAMIAEGEFGTW